MFRLHNSYVDYDDNNHDNNNYGDDKDEYDTIRDDQAEDIDLDVISQSQLNNSKHG